MAKPLNLVGLTFNNLKVIEKSTQRYTNGDVLWICECQCGTHILANANQLKTGNTKSCGCQKAKSIKTALYNDLTNRTFSRLTVIKASNRRGASGQYYWLCKCSCGNTIEVATCHLVSGATISCGCSKKEHLQKLFKLYRISKGLDPNVKMKSSFHFIYNRIKTQILNRDNHQCKLCGSTHNLHIHHIIPYNENAKLLNEPTNLITLCYECHSQAHNYGNWKTINKQIQIDLCGILERAKFC